MISATSEHREEIFEERFGKVLDELVFDDEVMGWVAQALRESHEDEKRHHGEAVDRLRVEQLSVTLRQPFDMLSKTAVAARASTATATGSDGRSAIWLRLLDSNQRPGD